MSECKRVNVLFCEVLSDVFFKVSKSFNFTADICLVFIKHVVQKSLPVCVSVAPSHNKRRRSVVPITPMPHYSDMDTPDLKNKLNRSVSLIPTLPLKKGKAGPL